MTVKGKRSAIITSDGNLALPEQPDVVVDHQYDAAALRAHIEFSGVQDVNHIAHAQDLYRDRALELIGKSGGSRVGLEITHRYEDSDDAVFNYQEGHIRLPVNVLSLRSLEVRQNGVHDDLLRVLTDMSQERSVPIGRLAIVRKENALSRDEVMDASRSNHLAISPKLDLEQVVQDDGRLVLPLEKLWFALCETNFRTDEKRAVIRFGKHGLPGIQEERKGLPSEIDAKGFFVGGIRISLGAYTAIIDQQTNKEGVVHLAARLLDGIRTSSLDVTRQVELFNKLYDAVTTKDLTVALRLYHSSKADQQFAKSVVNARTISQGVSFADVANAQNTGNDIIELADIVGPTADSEKPYGYFIGSHRGHRVPWVDHASEGFQSYHLKTTAPKFSAKDRGYFSQRDLPLPVERLAKKLGYVGQEQIHSNMFVSHAFPDNEAMVSMHRAGIGVFVAHDVRTHDKVWNTPQSEIDHDFTHNDVFFDSIRYAGMQDLHSKGAKFYMVRQEMPDAFNESETLDAEVLEWNERGFWIKPEIRDRLEEIDTVFAMYGSHVNGMEGVLSDQITRFALRLKQKLGKHIAFEHGKGPGLMYIADRIARQLPELAKEYPEFSDITEDIISIGIGIDLEQKGQKLNYHPHCQLDFRAHDRLVRQKIMNDRASVNIFNIGGAGTNEEVALSLCSQKLHNNIATPLIFVDPLRISKEPGENLYYHLEQYIKDIAQRKVVTNEHIENGYATIQLLQDYIPNFVHVVFSYDEAADIIEDFLDDPVGYYINAGMAWKEFEMDVKGASDIRKSTKFAMPHWIDLAQTLTDPRWDEVQSA